MTTTDGRAREMQLDDAADAGFDVLKEAFLTAIACTVAAAPKDMTDGELEDMLGECAASARGQALNRYYSEREET